MYTLSVKFRGGELSVDVDGDAEQVEGTENIRCSKCGRMLRGRNLWKWNGYLVKSVQASYKDRSDLVSSLCRRLNQIHPPTVDLICVDCVSEWTFEPHGLDLDA